MDLNKRNVAGMVTLYNSSVEVIENLSTYYNQVDKLYVIDNSEQPDEELKKLLYIFESCHYIWNGGNLGIGYSLNVAAHKAIQEGYKFLLTMDDDTRIPVNAIKNICSFLKSHNQAEKIGILTAAHNVSKWPDKARYRLTTMTSGNLLNLDIFKQVGPFREDFFIDHVDHEYGLRLNSYGFYIIELSYILLAHKLGTSKHINLFNKSFSFISHNPVRMYYIARNGIYTSKQYVWNYPGFLFTALKLIGKEMIKVVLGEDQKLSRIYRILQGLLDGMVGRLGKLSK